VVRLADTGWDDPPALGLGFSTLIQKLELDAWCVACPGRGQWPWPSAGAMLAEPR
jgi:hypothetical protein